MFAMDMDDGCQLGLAKIDDYETFEFTLMSISVA